MRKLALFPSGVRSDGVRVGATNEEIYDKKTYLRLRERDKTDMGQKINAFRLALVHKYTGENATVLDVGPGACTFLEAHGNCYGYDINPYVIELLKKKKLWFDPYRDSFDEANISGVTFFDVLEHINDPSLILRRLTDQAVVVSIPIFRNLKHMIGSKHFKPGEHKWNFTHKTFEEYMEWGLGFKVLEECTDETDLGREDIRTFVLKRKTNGH